MYPDAASSLREGLNETLIVNKLKTPGLLKKTLAITNTIESAFSAASNACRNVKHYSSGKMALRWLASGLYQSEKRFHRIKGYKELPILINSINNYYDGVDYKDDISYTQRVS